MGAMVTQYELMLVLRPDGAWDQEKERTSLVEKLLSGIGVTVKAVTAMGKKHLAYEIDKQSEGFYVLATLEGAAVKAGELEKQVRTGNDVLRYLLTVK